MVEMKQIEEFAKRVAAGVSPEKIVLFGSYATGKPDADSDVDLLVVLPFQGKSWMMASKIRAVARAEFPLNLIVRTPEQVSQEGTNKNSFLYGILQEGVTLYEA